MSAPSVSELSIKRKVEGQRFLIQEMIRQRNGCDSENGRLWYGRILRHCVISLLSTIGLLPHAERKAIIKELKGSGLLPLSIGRTSLKNHIRINMINLSPELFCWFINLKNS